MAEVIQLQSNSNKKPGKVLFGWIHNGAVREDFMMSILKFMDFNSRNRRISYGFKSVCGLYLAQNRNELTRIFLEDKDNTWLLCLDTDIAFDSEIVYKLLDAADPDERPIISALYFTYYGKNHMTTSDVVPLWSKYTEGGGYEMVQQIYANEIQQIDAMGFGCVLIHRSALEKFVGKYEDVWTWFGHDLITSGGMNLRLGEDYTFCHRARELGIPIFGHGDAIVTHTKVTPLNLQSVISHNQADIQYAESLEPHEMIPPDEPFEFEFKDN
jgi:hypothetical protein